MALINVGGYEEDIQELKTDVADLKEIVNDLKEIVNNLIKDTSGSE